MKKSRSLITMTEQKTGGLTGRLFLRQRGIPQGFGDV
jgi:hypothetical protein